MSAPSSSITQLINALDRVDLTGTKSVFLSGSIDKDAAISWQTQLQQALAHHPDVAVINPHRPDWDSSWKQDISFAPFRAQVEWELDMLERADLIAVYFSPASQAPITLLELGLFARSGKVVVACPEGFWKRGNVQVVCARWNIPLLEDLDALKREVERRLAEMLAQQDPSRNPMFLFHPPNQQKGPGGSENPFHPGGPGPNPGGALTPGSQSQFASSPVNMNRKTPSMPSMIPPPSPAMSVQNKDAKQGPPPLPAPPSSAPPPQQQPQTPQQQQQNHVNIISGPSLMDIGAPGMDNSEMMFDAAFWSMVNMGNMDVEYDTNMFQPNDINFGRDFGQWFKPDTEAGAGMGAGLDLGA